MVNTATAVVGITDDIVATLDELEDKEDELEEDKEDELEEDEADFNLFDSSSRVSALVNDWSLVTSFTKYNLYICI